MDLLLGSIGPVYRLSFFLPTRLSECILQIGPLPFFDLTTYFLQLDWIK